MNIKNLILVFVFAATVFSTTNAFAQRRTGVYYFCDAVPSSWKKAFDYQVTNGPERTRRSGALFFELSEGAQPQILRAHFTRDITRWSATGRCKYAVEHTITPDEIPQARGRYYILIQNSSHRVIGVRNNGFSASGGNIELRILHEGALSARRDTFHYYTIGIQPSTNDVSAIREGRQFSDIYLEQILRDIPGDDHDEAMPAGVRRVTFH